MKDKVIRKLARKSYSSWELKLKCADIPDIDAILEELQQKGYLNDEEWLQTFIKGQEAKGQSPLAIASKLRVKGIPRATIQASLAALDVDTALQKAIAKKSRREPSRQKLIASLMRQGFSYDAIQRGINKILALDP